MPTRRYFANAAPQQTLASSIGSTDTTLTVAGSFAGWPTQTPYFAVLEIGQTSMEIVLVTAVTGTTATISRGQNNTAAASHAAGATLDHGVVALDPDEANAHTTSSTGVHGVSGAVVGTTDTQTLTNKTLTSPIVNNGTVTGATLTDCVAHGDASNPALKGQPTTTGGRALSLTDSTGAEKAYVLDDGVVHGAGVNLSGAAVVTGSGSSYTGDATTGTALFLVPGKTGDVFYTTNVGNTVANFTVDDAGKVTHQGGWTIPQVQHGSVSATIAAGTNQVTGSVTFPTAFTAAPDVVATLESNGDNIGVTVYSITTTGFSFRQFTTSGSNAGTSVARNVHWFAAN